MRVADMAAELDTSIKQSQQEPANKDNSADTKKKHPLLMTSVGGPKQPGGNFDFHTRVLDEYRLYEITAAGGASENVLDLWREESARLPILSRVAS